MKAVLALIAIYVATFIIATQGASQNPVQASTPADNVSASSKSIDPVKAADLRSLLEFVGDKEQLKVVANESAAQYRDKLRSGAPEVLNASSTADRQAQIKAAEVTFKTNFDQQRALQQITGIYDKHFSEEEVKGLLDFFSSPLGQKFAAESPKIARGSCRSPVPRPPPAPPANHYAPCSLKTPANDKITRGHQQAASHHPGPVDANLSTALSVRCTFVVRMELAYFEAFLDFYVDTERPVLIPQRHDRYIAVHGVLHLNHLLLRRAHIRNISDR